MAALIGLFVGALVGNLLWHEWGAAVGGIAGFFAGVRFSAWRTQLTGGRSATARASAAPIPAERDGHGAGRGELAGAPNGELERRVASLEQRAAIGPEPVAAQEPQSDFRRGDLDAGATDRRDRGNGFRRHGRTRDRRARDRVTRFRRRANAGAAARPDCRRSTRADVFAAARIDCGRGSPAATR